MGWMIPIMVATSQRAEEDKLLAALVQQDAGRKFEFKILHGQWGEFRRPERLQHTLEQESRAQWELAMKLDDQRIVLRRPPAARSRDVLLGPEVDPYRTQIGASTSGKTVAIVVGVMLFGVALAMLVGFGAMGTAASGFAGPLILVAILVIIVLLAIIVAAKR